MGKAVQVQIKYQVKSNINMGKEPPNKEHALKHMHVRHYNYTYKCTAQIQRSKTYLNVLTVNSPTLKHKKKTMKRKRKCCRRNAMFQKILIHMMSKTWMLFCKIDFVIGNLYSVCLVF